MSQQKAPRFSSKLAMILTCMGMAVGTGNIWRFPKEVASNGGGSFLIPWILALFLWSIPLLAVELGVGKKTRKGPHGAFREILGPKWAWMGGFISLCAMLIMCYYAVVTGWTLRYVFLAFKGQLFGLEQETTQLLFSSFRGSLGALGFLFIALAVAGHFVYRGTKGIERINKILIPGLILILLIGAIKSLLLPGSFEGFGFLFQVEPERLKDSGHWIAGLTQSAWSTGAGWGLMLAYAVYAREEEDPLTTPVATGMGNNFIEVLVAVMIFPAVFALISGSPTDFITASKLNGGIAFETVPLLMNSAPGGKFMIVLFFIGLASAALTSLIAMLELSTRFFMDFGVTRSKALAVTLGMCVVLGAPSALNNDIFDNQDFVWGIGLILSGLFLTILVWAVGPANFYADFLGRKKANAAWFTILMGFVTLVTLTLLGWWLWNQRNGIAGQCALQWSVVILGLIIFEFFRSKKESPV